MAGEGGHAFHGLLPAVRVKERGEREVQISTERAHGVCCRAVVCMTILVGLLGSANPAQPVLLEKASTLPSARYRITLETPQTIFQWQDTAVVVRVQNRQGSPVDGILVTLQVDPAWTQYASLRPARARTQNGTVRAILRAELVGRMRITVRVGTLTEQATITVVMPIATRGGLTEACRSRSGAPDVLLGLT